MSAPTESSMNQLVSSFEEHFRDEIEERDSTDTESVQEPEEDTQEPESEEEDSESESPDTQEEVEEEAEEAEGEPEPEDEIIRSTDDLAKALGVELKDLNENLTVRIGEEEVPLSEVIERASQAPAPAQLAEMLGRQNQAISQAWEKMEQDFQANNAAVIGLTHHLLSRVEGDAGLSEATLAALKAEAPDEWAVKMEERRQLFSQIDSAIRTFRDAQEKHEAQKLQVLQQRHAEEGARMLQAVPEWAKDPEFAIEEATAISNLIQEDFGFTEEEMLQMPDHRLGLLMRAYYLSRKKELKSQETQKTLEKKKLTARRTTAPTTARRLRVDPAQTHRAASWKRQLETANDPSRMQEHLDAAAEGLAAVFNTK